MSQHEHIRPGDPRYDGFRIKQLWIVTGVDPSDNQEGILPITLPDAIRFSLLPGFAFASDELRAHHLREFARAVKQEDGMSLNIKHFTLDSEEQV